jgi:hypothetical protein
MGESNHRIKIHYILLLTIIFVASYHSFLDTGTNKLYTYNYHDKGNHELISCDLTTFDIEIIDIGYLPVGLAHNSVQNKIYISNLNTTELRIKTLNCVDNEFEEQELVLEGYNNCSGLLWVPDNRLYICAENGWNNPIPVILVYNLNSSTIEKRIYPYYTQVTNGHDAHFLYDSVNNQVFISIKTWGTNQGAVIIVDNDPDQNFPFSIINGIAHADKMKYNE